MFEELGLPSEDAWIAAEVLVAAMRVAFPRTVLHALVGMCTALRWA